VTDAGATLGRVLFYDKRLSRNGSVACASCHQQSHGFSDPRPLSVGWDGRETGRHSMPVHDARFYARDRFFWDERTTTLEAQVLEPIQNELEMGMTLGEVEQRLAEADYYPPLFEAAFGDPAMTSERVALALAQFVRAMVPHQSRWDAAVAQVESIAGDLPGLSAEENRGKEIFFGQHDPSTRGLCGTCHLMQNELAFVPPGAPPPALGNTAIFFMIAPANNGLDAAGEGDPGVGGGDRRRGRRGEDEEPLAARRGAAPPLHARRALRHARRGGRPLRRGHRGAPQPRPPRCARAPGGRPCACTSRPPTRPRSSRSWARSRISRSAPTRASPTRSRASERGPEPVR
jgi:cytochrome c peroxidase